MDLGQDDYPKTVSDAYELLNRTTNEITTGGRVNHCVRGSRGGKRLVFAQQGESGNNDSFGLGTDGRVIYQVTCWNCNMPGNLLQFCLSPPMNNTNTSGRRNVQALIFGFLFSQNCYKGIPTSWILLCNSFNQAYGLTVTISFLSQLYLVILEKGSSSPSLGYRRHALAVPSLLRCLLRRTLEESICLISSWYLPHTDV